MAKGNHKSQQKSRSSYASKDASAVTFDPRFEREEKPKKEGPLKPQNEAQARYMNAIRTSDLIFGVGPAGTGKTYIAAAMAAEAMENKGAKNPVKKIIVTRPAVEAGGEELGFLPGELHEKYEPYLRPVRDVLIAKLGKGVYDCAIKNKNIEPIPLGYMRGMTFNDAWVILDEAQNVSPAQMKMFLTRIGNNCKVIVCGDMDQVDIEGESGLRDAVRRRIKGSETFEFELEDVVRSGMVLNVLRAYSNGYHPISTHEGGGDEE